MRMTTHLSRVLALLAAMLTPTALPAEEKPKPDAPAGDGRSDFALTIYSSADPAGFDPRQFAQNGAAPVNGVSPVPGYGVVRETRRVELVGGENTLRFTGVAAGIDPTTVAFKSLTAPGTTSVIEQDYQYDLAGADKVLEKYLGQTITVRAKGLPEQDDLTLLAAEPGMLVLRNSEERGGQIRLIPRGDDLSEITLPKLPKGLIIRPTLVWKVAAEKAGKHDVQVSYQTNGMTWRADYNLVVAKDSKKADVGAWVSLLNESGASYPDARLKLVAGDVQRVEPPQRVYSFQARAPSAPAPMAQGFQEKAFFEYHLYTLGRKTSLADRSTKQIELFPTKAGVPVVRTFVYYGLPVGFRSFMPPAPNQDRNLGTQANKKVDVYLLLKNNEANGLGVPLPAGRVRVYQRDEADAALEFVGEDTIAHTPKGEDVMVKLGSAFDVVGDRRQTDFQPNLPAQVITETVEVTLRNHKDEPVRVIVKEILFRWTRWSITQTTDPFEKQDSRTVHFTVEVPPDGERKVRYTVRYSW